MYAVWEGQRARCSSKLAVNPLFLLVGCLHLLPFTYPDKSEVLICSHLPTPTSRMPSFALICLSRQAGGLDLLSIAYPDKSEALICAPAPAGYEQPPYNYVRASPRLDDRGTTVSQGAGWHCDSIYANAAAFIARNGRNPAIKHPSAAINKSGVITASE